LRDELRGQPPEELAARAGVQWNGDSFDILLLGKPYRITYPDFVVRFTPSDEPCPEELQAMLLDYLKLADGTQPAGRWVSYRELPHGQFYYHAFQGYAERPLVQEVGNDVERLAQAARSAGGREIDYGDCGYAFDVLPQVKVALVYWKGDEEFPPTASVLFDASAERYLPVDGLAQLGRMVSSRVAKEYRSLGG